MNDDELRDKLITEFKNNGKEGKYVKYFDSLSDEVKRELTKEIDDNEFPSIVYHAPSHWYIVTTRNFVMSIPSGIRKIPNCELKNIELDMKEISQRTARRPTDLRFLKLILSDGEKLSLNLEAGRPLNGFRNVVQYIIDSNT